MEFVDIEEGYLRFCGKRKFLETKMEFKNDREIYIRNFFFIDEFEAVYSIYKQNDLAKAKNCYYEASMALAYCVEKLGHSPFGILRHSLYPVLSDNNKIIQKYCSYRATANEEKLEAFPIHFGYAVQTVLNDNNKDLQHHIGWMTKRSKSGFFKKMTGVVTVFEGILDRDIPKIESGLKDIVKRLKKDQPPIIGNYMNIEATGLAKLAWRKGLEVDIKSTFIPQALLPIKELEHYESYDFFKHQD